MAPFLQFKRRLECIRKGYREDMVYILSTIFGKDMVCPCFETFIKLHYMKVPMRVLYKYYTFKNT
jgi:hypothetical protein